MGRLGWLGWDVVRMVEVIRMVEVVYLYEEILGVKGPNSKSNNKKDVGLHLTMPQAAGKKFALLLQDYP